MKNSVISGKMQCGSYIRGRHVLDGYNLIIENERFLFYRHKRDKEINVLRFTF